MKKIFVIIAKSACGKDTLYYKLMELGIFKKIILYYTREQRPGEVNGETYWFVDDNKMNELINSGKLIAKDVYPIANTNGVTIALLEDEQFNGDGNFLAVMSFKFYKGLVSYFKDRKDVEIIPIYINVSYEERMIRYMKREEKKDNPNYKEICRRFIVDEQDFPEDELSIIPKSNWFANYDFDKFYNEVLAFIKDRLNINGKLAEYDGYFGFHSWNCPICKKDVSEKPNFCPNCGTKLIFKNFDKY